MTALENKLDQAKPVLLKALRRTDADFVFYVVRNREMNKIKKELMSRPDFRGREARKIAAEETVNVLSFPEPESFPHPESGKKMLGEIYLNYDYGRGRFEVLGPLFIHGFLHLLGYLHWTKRDTIKMQKLEKHLWEIILSSV